MRDVYTRSLLAHTAMLGVGCAAACGYAVEIFTQPMPSLVVAACAFTAAMIALLRYDAAGWMIPAGVERADLRLRRDVGAALGAGAVACAALTASGHPLLRALTVCQTLVMAVAAVNDFARFRLPLPATIIGAALAIAAAMQHATWPWNAAFGCVAGVVLVIVNRRAARADLAGGDELALVWIALADPVYGAAAICAGQFFLHASMRVFDPRRVVRRVPIGGAWLMAAAWLLPLLRAWEAI